jgi:hypothetical protein
VDNNNNDDVEECMAGLAMLGVQRARPHSRHCPVLSMGGYNY